MWLVHVQATVQAAIGLTDEQALELQQTLRSLTASASRGFRAANAFDLGAIGVSGGGFELAPHEAARLDARVGTDDGATFYAARSNEGASTCLVLVDDAAGEGVSSCTMTPNPTGTEVSDGTSKAMFVVPGTDFTSLEQSGWTRLGDFLAVR